MSQQELETLSDTIRKAETTTELLKASIQLLMRQQDLILKLAKELGMPDLEAVPEPQKMQLTVVK